MMLLFFVGFNENEVASHRSWCQVDGG